MESLFPRRRQTYHRLVRDATPGDSPSRLEREQEVRAPISVISEALHLSQLVLLILLYSSYRHGRAHGGCSIHIKPLVLRLNNLKLVFKMNAYFNFPGKFHPRWRRFGRSTWASNPNARNTFFWFPWNSKKYLCHFSPWWYVILLDAYVAELQLLLASFSAPFLTALPSYRASFITLAFICLHFHVPHH